MFRLFKAFILLVALALLVVSAPAYADDCSSRVVDSTGKADVGSIKSALSVLISDGADPMVRIVTNAQASEAGNLDKLVVNTLHRCAAWQSPGGNMKSNLLVLIVGPDMSENQIGIFFSKRGSLTMLNGQTGAVRAEMSSKFKSDLNGAIKAGIEALHSKLSNRSAVGIGAGTVNGNVTIINKGPEKPSNFTPLYILFAIIVGVVILILYMRKQSAKAKARGAQQSAQSKRAECNNILLGFDNKMLQIGALLSSAKGTINDSEFTDYQTRLGGIQSQINTAKGQFTNLQGSGNDPDSVGRTAEEYDSMTADFSTALVNIKSIDSALSTFEDSVREIKNLQSSAQPAIDAMMSEIERATTAVGAEKVLKTDGPKATLSQAMAQAERANQEMADKRYKAVASTCKDATALARKAAQQVSELGARKAKIDAGIQQLDASNPATKLISADAAISTLRTGYGDDVAAKATVHRATITQNTDLRKQAVMAAKSSSFAQNWDLAEQKVSEAQSADNAIDSAIAAIKDIGPSIERAKAEAARAAERAAYRPSSGGYRSRSSSSRTVINNNTTVIYGRDPYGNALDQWGNVIAAELLIDAIERSEWERRERELDRRDDYRRADYDDDRRSSSRNDDDDVGGDSGSILGGSSCNDDDVGGDSGDAFDSSDNDVSGGDDD